MTGIDINKYAFDWLIRHYDHRILGDMLPKIQQWAKGESMPELSELRDLARLTQIPLRFFCSEAITNARVPVKFALSRELDQVEQGRILKVLQVMRRRQGWMRFYITSSGVQPPKFHDPEQPMKVAWQILAPIKRDLGNAPSWHEALELLYAHIDRLGITVMHASIGANRGIALYDDLAPFICLHRLANPSLRMLLLANCLVHVLLGKRTVFDMHNLCPAQDSDERLCDKITLDFLLPIKEIFKAWRRVCRERDVFAALAAELKVSECIAARCAYDIGFVAEEEFLDFCKNYKHNYIKPPKIAGACFVNAVLCYVRNGFLSVREAANLTGLGETSIGRMLVRPETTTNSVPYTSYRYQFS